MAGNKTGGIAAAETNKQRHGADFYARIGAIGGKKGRTGGFAANRELARIAGAKGGRISRRSKAVASTTDDQAVVLPLKRQITVKTDDTTTDLQQAA